MATITSEQRTDLPRPIASKLARLRWAIRGYLVLHAVAMLVSAIVVGFWVSLFVDWLFEPSVPVRIGILLAIVITIGVVLVYRLASRVLVPLTNRNMAVLLERRYRQLGDHLLTTVELGARGSEEAEFDMQMFGHTSQRAEQMVGRLKPHDVLNFRPLLIAALAAALLVGTVLAYGALQAESIGLWSRRAIMLENERWPRETRIEVVGFPKVDGRRLVKVAKGSDLEVRARADTDIKLVIPKRLEIHYEGGENGEGKANMTRKGEALPGRDDYQDYIYTFRNIQSPLRFDVIAARESLFGKNDRIDNLWIEAVDPPELSQITLTVKYPKYLGRENADIKVTGIMALPEGCEVDISATATKSLREVRSVVHHGSSETPGKPARIDSDDPHKFFVPLGKLDQDTAIAFTLRDSDEVENQQPIRLQLTVVMDEPPEVEARLAGIGKKITPLARLPFRGKISDDHGVQRVWFDWKTPDDGDSDQNDLNQIPESGEFDETSGIAFDVQPLEMKPGSRLLIAMKASDHYDLGQKPNERSGQRYELEVVTESQLRAHLEKTEITLGADLEKIITDLRRTRDQLTHMKSRKKETAPAEKPAPATEPGDEKSDDKKSNDKDSEVKESKESPDREKTAEEKAKREAMIRSLRAEESLRTAQLARHAILEVASGLDRILVELENNRVSYLEDQRDRLSGKISEPLKTLAGEPFDELERRLKQLRSAISNENELPGAIVASQQQIDLVLREMDQVLQKMVRLQNLKQLFADLRKMINSNKEIQRLTKELGKEIKDDLKEELRKGLLD